LIYFIFKFVDILKFVFHDYENKIVFQPKTGHPRVRISYGRMTSSVTRDLWPRYSKNVSTYQK